MGKVNYEEALKQQNTFNDGPYIQRFFLSDDKDEAVVRIMHNDASTFDVVVSHNVQTNGKYRDINCERDFTDPVSKCPLCEAGNKSRSRMYIHLLQYTKNDNGEVEVIPKVWDRSVSYAEKLVSYLDNYGPLSDIVCKIIRHGAKGSMQTTYEIVPNLSPKIYTDDVYVKDETLFEGYNSVGTVVWTKSIADMQYYVQHGDFPQKTQQGETTEESSPLDVKVEAPVPPTAEPVAAPVNSSTTGTTPVNPQVRTTNSTPPWERSASTAVERPRRQY